MNPAEARAALIIRGLSGHHLHGFLPGQDNQAAITETVSSKHGWSGPLGGWCQVTRDGIGRWPCGTGMTRGRRPDAVLFVAWDEVLGIIARGCEDGHRERYEAAYRAWCASVRPGPRGSGFTADDETPVHEATAALIRHGCEQAETVLVQGSLFDDVAGAA